MAKKPASTEETPTEEQIIEAPAASATSNESPAAATGEPDDFDGPAPQANLDVQKEPSDETQKDLSPTDETQNTAPITPAAPQPAAVETVNCHSCGWTGPRSDMKVDPKLQRPHYCPSCGRSDTISVVE